MAERSSGASPRRPSRATVAARPNPQSSNRRVPCASTTSALPWLPLPRDANRIQVSRMVTEKRWLFQFLLQQGQDASGSRRRRFHALGVEHLDLAALRRPSHADAVLFIFLRSVAPERQLRPEPFR